MDLNNKRVLIVKMSSLGDIIHALPSLYVLKKTYPKVHITWAVHPAFAGILPGKPWIDEIFLIDRNHIKDIKYLRKVRKELHARHFDLTIDLQMIAKSALISFLSGSPSKIGYNDAREGSWLVSRPIHGSYDHGHIIEQLLDVMRYLGCTVPAIEFPFRDFSKETESMSVKLGQMGVQSPFVLLIPGTRGEAKKWPVEDWADLSKKLNQSGYDTIIAGAPSEINLGAAVKEKADSMRTFDLTGKTTLLELCALEKAASLHISCDTGPLHIANGLHTPIIALFGPTLPDRSGPYGNKNSQVILAPHAGTKECSMSDITVDEVLKASVSMLEKR
jgi:heptosyltransferase-1